MSHDRQRLADYLGHLEAYEQSRQQTLANLRTDIQAGMADMAAGQVTPFNAAAIKQRGRTPV